MNYLQHGSTTILADNGVDDWMIHLVTQCLDFNTKMNNTKLILLKRSLGENNHIGLTVDEMDGFILFLDSMDIVMDRHEKTGVAPVATKTHLIVDTMFHEMHHVESYHEDSDWVTKHESEEEWNANEVASSLCVEFFKLTKLEVPLQDVPYIYKSGLTVIADLREYFNVLLDDEAEWDALPLPLSTWATNLVDRAISVESNIDPQQTVGNFDDTPMTTSRCNPSFDINTYTNNPPAQEAPAETMGEKAMKLYNACFNKIFGGCLPSAEGFTAPEKILEAIPSQGIITSATITNQYGAPEETPIGATLTGLIFKTSKLPAYEFTLVDGKKRVIVPQNPTKRDANGAFTATAIRAQAGEKIGYIIDKEQTSSFFATKTGL